MLDILFTILAIMACILGGPAFLVGLWIWSIRLPAGYRTAIKPGGTTWRWRYAYALPGKQIDFDSHVDVTDFPRFLARSFVAHGARSNAAYRRHIATPVQEFNGPPIPGRFELPEVMSPEDRAYIEEKSAVLETPEKPDANAMLDARADSNDVYIRGRRQSMVDAMLDARRHHQRIILQMGTDDMFPEWDPHD